MNIQNTQFVCPCCQSKNMSFTILPPTVRTYSLGDEFHRDDFGITRDYHCKNCGAEFTLTEWK